MKKLLICGIILFQTHAFIQAQITYQQFADSLHGDYDDWVALRVENALNGVVEKIEMPLVVRTRAWGCRCPDNYIGVGVNVLEGPWIFPISEKKLPQPDETGYSLIVVGYFTGTWKELDLRKNDKEPAEWLYKVAEFKIISWKTNTKGEDAPAPNIIR